MSFVPGDRVICVRDRWDIFPSGQAHNLVPMEGCEYVVRSAYFDPIAGQAIRLHWLFSPLYNGFEPGWSVRGMDGALHFRRVIRTDISVFQSALVSPPRELADTR